MTRKFNFKLLFGYMLAFVFAFSALLPVGITYVAADSKLTIADLLEDYSDGSDNDQEITDKLSFTTDFGDSKDSVSSSGWTTLTNQYTDISFTGSVKFVDLSSADDTFEYVEGTPIAYNTFGADNEYGAFFLTSTAGLAGIESSTFSVPAHSLYVLTFKVKVGHVANSKGINAKIIDTTTDKIFSMSAIKTVGTTYTTYAFLIRGNEFESHNIKIQLIWGNVTESDGKYSESKELGYAAVDSFHLFSVNATQYEELASVTANTVADLSTANTSYIYIPNGYFSFSDNRKWDLTTSQSITDLKPSGWTQTTTVTDENSRLAHYGIIDVESMTFGTRITQLGLPGLINPGNITGQAHNNVLLLYNQEATWQTITSGQTKLAKNSYYEISFKFNTPKLQDLAEDEKNSLSFYIIDSDGKTIYSRENMFSYTDWDDVDNADNWATFRTFIRTSTTDAKFNFVIKFGTETESKEGYAYVDEVVLAKKASANTMFENNLEDTFKIKTEDGADTEYLATGTISFSALSNLDTTDISNRGLATYDYTTAVITDDDEDDDEEDEDDEETTDSSSNISYLWYVIPSVLLGLCTIFGLIIFYARKLKSKVKLPKRKRKNSYDRKKTLEKQVSQREKAEGTDKISLEKQLKSVRSQIEKLESNYQKSKSSPLALKEYVKKREKLQNEELKIQNKLNTN